MDRNNAPPVLPARSRWLCLSLAIALIPLGLATRAIDSLPPWVILHAGDVLWATLMFWLLATVFHRLSTTKLLLLTVLVAFAVEFSQLIDDPILNALRANRWGALVLGQGFLAVDLLRYCFGALLGAMIDWTILRKKSSLPE